MIPYGKQEIDQSDVDSIIEVLGSDFLTQGPKVPLFEETLANYCTANYGVAASTATSALHIALMTLGVTSNHEVIVPTITFIAPINAVRYCKAEPIFMDVDNNFCIDEVKTINFINNETIFKNGNTYNKLNGKKISAIIVTHLFGRSMLLDKVVKLCKKKNIKILEDASESLGNFFLNGKYKGKHTGTIGDVGCLSFNGNKIITAGGGGMILTNNKEIYKRSLYLTTQAKDDGELFIHNEIGYNYRLSNVHAAIGLAQLENLYKVLSKKKKIYELYKKKLKNNSCAKLLEITKSATSNYWLNIVSMNKKYTENEMKKLVRKFAKEQIEVRPVWKLNHLQKEFKKNQKYLISNASKIVRSSVCLPSNLKLNENDINRVIELLT